MLFSVYETKFTVGKSKEMVFTEGRGEIGGGNSKLGNSRKRFLDKTLAKTRYCKMTC